MRPFFRKIAILAAAAMLTACSPASCDTLYRKASHMHGKCTIVSKSESDSANTVIVHDELQDFNYKVSSSMQDIMIDGSNFGSLASSGDTFEQELKNKVFTETRDALDEACSADNIRYEPIGYESEMILVVYAADESSGKTAALKCAAALQEQNMKNRLDGNVIRVCESTDEDWPHCESFGSIKLPDIKWRTPDDELADYYTEMARQQTDPNAVFIRAEKGKFSDTGADLDKVVHALGSDYPIAQDSPVTFYYFTCPDGGEYYLCDFNYYNDTGSFAWYTNYREYKKRFPDS